MPEEAKKISLFYKDGASDKEYHTQLEPQGNGHVVTFQYGRRGNALQTGTKTATPVPYDKALKIWEKLVAEKVAKGYTQGPDGTPFAGSVEKKASGLSPQLLNPIEEEELEALFKDSEWIMQEKFDGVRKILRKRGDTVEGINRKGVLVPLPQPIIDHMELILCDVTLDTEQVGDICHVFDILYFDNEDLSEMRVDSRSWTLHSLGDTDFTGPLRLVDTAWSEPAKRRLFSEIRDSGGEGVCFKSRSARYIAGRPNSGGNWRKFKFTATATCGVARRNPAKRSVALQVKGPDGTYIDIGNVTIPANAEIPEVGTLCEIRYLYCFSGGSLFQPVYLGPRDDIDEADAYSSLKFKAAGADPDDETSS